jgi:hypothetical protein
MKCRSGRAKIDIHPSPNPAVTDAAANGPLRAALFPSGSRAICKCSAGECARGACDALYILDDNDVRIAGFYGADFRAANETDSGGLSVYRMPARTNDAAIDAAADLIRNRLADIKRGQRNVLQQRRTQQ